jgi:predicted  nucleic acid-binding Zn-ribbon protein
MSDLHLLYDLQQIDSEIRARKKRLRDVLDAQKENPVLAAAQRQRETTAAALDDVRHQLQRLEVTLRQLNDNARRTEERMYSGKVSNPKELEDLAQQKGALGRRRVQLEDEMLELMLAVEEAEAADAEAAETLEAEEAAWEAELDRLQKTQNELATRLNALLAERRDLLPRIEPSLLATYEKESKGHGGVAVATLNAELCTVCGVRVSARKVRAVTHGELTYCGSCGRILVST